MIVCVCNNVSDRDIAREAAAGCPSFGQLQMRTGVASGCGACHECARETFAEHRAACVSVSQTISLSAVAALLPRNAEA
ncbi:MAG: (2Fe-2S)-binding protein [Steroidobacteraceae bacterium]